MADCLVTFVDPSSCVSGVPINCHFSWRSPFQPMPGDWLALFKVGWSNLRERVEWLAIDPETLIGKEKGTVQFTGLNISSPDFYQFVYVCSEGRMCGASAPFTIQSAEDGAVASSLGYLEEELSDDEEMLMVTSRASRLATRFTELEKEKCKLQSLNSNILSEQKVMQEKLNKSEEIVKLLKDENTALHLNLEELNEYRGAMERVKALQNEVDQVNGHASLVTAERDLYKQQAERSEKERKSCQTQLLQYENNEKKLQEVYGNQEKKLQEVCGNQEKKLQEVELELDCLRNQLDASESRRLVYSSEISTLTETLSQLSNKVESVTIENDNLKTQMAAMQRQVEQQTSEGKNVQDLTERLDMCKTEWTKLYNDKRKSEKKLSNALLDKDKQLQDFQVKVQALAAKKDKYKRKYLDEKRMPGPDVTSRGGVQLADSSWVAVDSESETEELARPGREEQARTPVVSRIERNKSSSERQDSSRNERESDNMSECPLCPARFPGTHGDGDKHTPLEEHIHTHFTD